MEQNFEKPKDVKQISDVIWEIPTSFKKGMRVPARFMLPKNFLMVWMREFLIKLQT